MTKILTESGLIERDYALHTEGDLTDRQIPSLQQATEDNLSTESVWLDGDSDFDQLKPKLPELNLIAIHFKAFTDGRGYSLAFRIRNELDYKGDLLACGDVLLDQLSFMKRVGFNQFWLREDQPIEQALLRFNDFKDPYQQSVTPDNALFER